MWQPNYATEGELMAHARGHDLDDAALALAVATASRAIDDRTKRQFGHLEVAEPRVYTPRWSRSRGGWLVPIDDLMTAAGVAVTIDRDADGVFETGVDPPYLLQPGNAVVKGWPWDQLLIPATPVTVPLGAGTGQLVTTVPRLGPDSVQVVALWGWPGVPDAVRQACLLQASRLLARRDAPFGVAGSPEAGSEVRLLSRLDPDVAVAVEPYRRRVWVA